MRTRYTAQEIIDKVDEQYKNIKTTPYKIGKINEAIDKLYDKIGDDDMIEMQTSADVSLYTLDDTIEFDQINTLTVSTGIENPGDEVYTNQIAYKPLGLHEDLVDYSYFKATEGVIGIYPTPTENGHIIRISYQSVGAYVTAATDTVELERDHIMAVVYYVMAKIAEANDDFVKFNNFTRAYNDENNDIKEREWDRDGKYPTVRDVSAKPTSRSRRYSRSRYLGRRY